MEEILERLIEDFNERSELVALNYAQKREGRCNEDTLQWNRGSMNIIEEYLVDMADKLGVNLIWECKEHDFGSDDWKRILEYRTVSVRWEELEKVGA